MTRHWHWGTKIALVYTLFATGTLTMVGIAVSQRTDLVAPDYYARALKQDERMAALNNVASLGSSFSATQTEGGELVVHWPHRPEGGSIVLYRASNADADQTVALAPAQAPDGSTQRVSLQGLQTGAWRAQITWSWQGRPHYTERDLVIR
ncbi:MAG: hypothetical protein AMXMBFR57_13450 [Acidimicrobiia bacterium]|jgi:hypothetical protein